MVFFFICYLISGIRVDKIGNGCLSMSSVFLLIKWLIKLYDKDWLLNLMFYEVWIC